MIIVETGVGLSNSVSYASVSQADRYHSARGNEAWDNADSDEKEIALVRATSFIDSFERKFIGYRLTDTQALAWPRDEEGIPLSVLNATIEAALIELKQRGELTTISSGNVIREKIGPIEIAYSNAQEKKYPAIMNVLDPVLVRGVSVRRG